MKFHGKLLVYPEACFFPGHVGVRIAYAIFCPAEAVTTSAPVVPVVQPWEYHGDVTIGNIMGIQWGEMWGDITNLNLPFGDTLICHKSQ